MKHSYFVAKILIFFGIFIFINADRVLANQEIIETSGSYVMDSRLDETPATATARAREEAKRNAVEKAGTYIQAYSKMIDFELDHDEVRTVAAQVLKIQDEKSTVKVIQDNLLEFTVYIKALVDDSNEEVLKAMMTDKKNLEESTRQNNELQKKYDELTLQMAELKQKYDTVTETQQLELKKIATKNNDYFRAIQELERGNEFYQRREYEKALSSYDQAIILDSQSAEFYNNRGLAHYHLKNFADAVNDFSRALEINTSFAYAYNNRGMVRTTVGNVELAIQDYTKAIQLNPKLVDALNNRGNAYASLGQYQNALLDLQTAIGLSNNDSEIHNNLGNVYLSMQRYEDAIREYDRAVILNPSYSDAYYNRSIARLHCGNYSDALTDIQKAMQLNPNDSAYRALLNQIESKRRT